MSRVFYGWRIVAVAFLADFFAVGFLFYSYGVFFKAIAADLGGSRLGVSLGLVASFTVGSMLAPFLGRALDRYSIRWIMVAGACTASVGYGLVSQIQSLPQFYAVFALFVGVGVSAMGGLSSATLVSNWFVARRGTALGVATIGISLSGFIMPPVATALIESLGWRAGYMIYAAATLFFVVPPVLLFVVNRPEHLGLHPDGANTETPRSALTPSVERSWSTRDLLRERSFWGLALFFGLAFFATSGTMVHLIPHATDLGIDQYRAALCLSVTAGAGTIAKFGFGYLIDRVSPRIAVVASVSGQLLGLVGISQSGRELELLASSAVFGLGMGGLVPLQGALTGRFFGRLSYGKAAGLMRPLQIPFHAMGAPLAGYIFDTSGSYNLAFAIFCGAYLLSLSALLAFRDRGEG